MFYYLENAKHSNCDLVKVDASLLNKISKILISCAYGSLNVEVKTKSQGKIVCTGNSTLSLLTVRNNKTFLRELCDYPYVVDFKLCSNSTRKEIDEPANTVTKSFIPWWIIVTVLCCVICLLCCCVCYKRNNVSF